MTKYYAGIGSRETPKDICDIMTQLAIKLANNGWVLRSGGAKGADRSRFEKEIFYAK
jgi:predicted Rossmann fold nucleotide-binding protein DprA/Smf involved in DNA uptake